jgi:hypothetical protein
MISSLNRYYYKEKRKGSIIEVIIHFNLVRNYALRGFLNDTQNNQKTSFF